MGTPEPVREPAILHREECATPDLVELVQRTSEGLEAVGLAG